MTVSPYTIFLFFLISPICLTHAETQANPPSDLIGDICSQTRNPTSCSNVLRSFRGSGTANITKLAQDTIHVARTSTYFTFDFIHSLFLQERNGEMRRRYNTCGYQYTRAMDALKNWQQLLQSGDYGQLADFAAAAERGIEDCDGNFARPPGEPEDLVQKTDRLKNVISIVLVFSQRLGSNI